MNKGKTINGKRKTGKGRERNKDKQKGTKER